MKEYLEPTKYLKINLIGRVVKNAWMIVGFFCKNFENLKKKKFKLLLYPSNDRDLKPTKYLKINSISRVFKNTWMIFVIPYQIMTRFSCDKY
jgi:predicted permease